MKAKVFLYAVASALLIAAVGEASAWGPRAHAAIGQAAVERVSDGTRSGLQAILAVESEDDLDRAIAFACFWPDTIRGDPEWAWSAPLHYVNIPRDSGRYERGRDCPGGLCVTEAIRKYAADLGRGDSSDPGLESAAYTSQWYSFAWLCHLVADLHQPLHAGFADDRGGNRVEVELHGERLNLHRFWDSALIAERLPRDQSAAGLARLPPLSLADSPCTSSTWRPDLAECWTNESHALASSVAYPSDPVLSEDFADQSWSVIRAQCWRAAQRLALVLDAVLAGHGPENRTAGWRKPGRA